MQVAAAIIRVDRRHDGGLNARGWVEEIGRCRVIIDGCEDDFGIATRIGLECWVGWPKIWIGIELTDIGPITKIDRRICRDGIDPGTTLHLEHHARLNIQPVREAHRCARAAGVVKTLSHNHLRSGYNR